MVLATIRAIAHVACAQVSFLSAQSLVSVLRDPTSSNIAMPSIVIPDGRASIASIVSWSDSVAKSWREVPERISSATRA